MRSSLPLPTIPLPKAFVQNAKSGLERRLLISEPHAILGVIESGFPTLHVYTTIGFDSFRCHAYVSAGLKHASCDEHNEKIQRRKHSEYPSKSL